MARKSQDTDSEGPRGRTGRPETPSSSANSSRSRRSNLSQRVHFEEPDMCNPLASPRSDVTVTAVPVRVPAKSANPKVGVPASVDSRSPSLDPLPSPSHDKRNAFAQRKGKVPAVQSSSPSPHLSSHPSSRPSLRSSSIPPVPPLPVSILKNRPGNITLAEVKPRSSSAPPSPPKMADSSNVSEGNNKPLPASPSKYDPHTPSPRTPSFKKDGMHHPVSPMERVTGISPTNTHRSSLTALKDLPEAVRSLQYNYEADIKRVTQKIDDINKLEQKVDDFVTLTQDYIKDHMNAQHDRNSDLSFEVSKANLDAKDAKDQVQDLKEQIHEMRTEINGLTSSFNDLSAKVDMCLTGIWDNTEEPFVAYQRRKNKEIDEDIQDIGDVTVDHTRQLLFVRQMVIRNQTTLNNFAHDNGFKIPDDVDQTLPPNPLPARGTVPPTGTLRSLVPSESAGIPPAKTASPVSATPPATATPPASTTASATVTPPASSTVKQSSIPRRSKKNRSKKSSSSTVSKQPSTTDETSKNTGRDVDNTSGSAEDFNAKKDAIDKEDASDKGRGVLGLRRRDGSVPPVPAIPQGISRIHGDASRDVPIPLGDIHPLFRPQFNEVNAAGIPAIQTPVGEVPGARVSRVEAGKDEARK